MEKISSLSDMKSLFQAGFEDNEETLSKYGESRTTQLKAYLIESNCKISDQISIEGYGSWKKLDGSHSWYVNLGTSYDNLPGSFFLDTTRNRVWVLYSLVDAGISDSVVLKWISGTNGLDRCWLSRNQLLHYKKKENWHEKGIGIKFSDGLTHDEDDVGNFSLKAWYGARRKLPGLVDVIEKAKDNFAIYSARWQKITDGSVSISAEWYSNGKVTINRALDVDNVMLSVTEMANIYEDAITNATEVRNKKMGAFELNFKQNIDLDAFKDTVSMGRGTMNLWLVETESEKDFRRFKGVDLHTWDRILIDVGEDYAYLTIPGKGCVNAAPRIATLQGEDNGGKTSIYFDGVEMFA